MDQVGALGDPVPLSFPLIRLPADASPIIQHHVPYTFCLRFLSAGLGLGFPVLLPVGCFHYIRLTDPLIGTESRRLRSGCSADPPERNPTREKKPKKQNPPKKERKKQKKVDPAREILPGRSRSPRLILLSLPRCVQPWYWPIARSVCRDKPLPNQIAAWADVQLQTLSFPRKSRWKTLRIPCSGSVWESPRVCGFYGCVCVRGDIPTCV